LALVTALSKYPLYALGLEHIVHRHSLDSRLTVCRCARRICPVPFNLPRLYEHGNCHFYHVPGATDLVVYSSGICDCRIAPAGLAMGFNLDVSDFFGTLFSMVTDGLFQDDSS